MQKLKTKTRLTTGNKTISKSLGKNVQPTNRTILSCPYRRTWFDKFIDWILRRKI